MNPDRIAGRHEGSGCLSVVGGWLIAIAEILIVAACIIVMYAGLKTNGQVFTETLEATRRKTWDGASIVAIVAGSAASAYFLLRFVRTRSPASVLVLIVQLALLLLTIRLVIWFHGAIVLPPGIHSKGIPSY